MCDHFGCGWDAQTEGPPTNLPAWFKCPASITEKVYPAPQGVDIMPITEGGRNGPSKKKKFACGACGQQKKKPTNVKPNITGDCPMMKTQIQLGKCELSPKPTGVMARMKEFFANIGKK